MHKSTQNRQTNHKRTRKSTDTSKTETVTVEASRITKKKTNVANPTEASPKKCDTIL